MLECLICKNIFNNLKILKCFYLFCCKCFESYDVIGVGINFIVCFFCWKLILILLEGVFVFLSNFFLINVLDYLFVKLSKEYIFYCINCEDEVVVMLWCLECVEFLCLNCVLVYWWIWVIKDYCILLFDML